MEYNIRVLSIEGTDADRVQNKETIQRYKQYDITLQDSVLSVNTAVTVMSVHLM